MASIDSLFQAREADKDKRQLLEMLKLAKERPCDAERAVWNAQLRGWGSHKIDEYGPSHEDGCTGIHAQEELGEGAGSNTGELPVGKDDNLDAPDGDIYMLIGGLRALTTIEHGIKVVASERNSHEPRLHLRTIR